MENGKTEKANKRIAIWDKVYEKVKAESTETGRTITDIASKILWSYYEKQEPQKKPNFDNYNEFKKSIGLKTDEVVAMENLTKVIRERLPESEEAKEKRINKIANQALRNLCKKDKTD
jgi:hypothetical protein